MGGFLGDIYGAKYGIANPTATAGNAIAGNISNLPALSTLTLGTDSIAAQGAQLPYLQNLPNYSAMLGSASSNATSELQGQVPQDVINQLQQGAAEGNVSGGFGANSPAEQSGYMKALGLTSLGLENQGMSQFSQLYGMTPTGAQFNPSSMFVTPSQEQAAQMAANKEAAAPDPELNGLISDFT